jgi:hypothetical protein
MMKIHLLVHEISRQPQRLGRVNTVQFNAQCRFSRS